MTDAEDWVARLAELDRANRALRQQNDRMATLYDITLDLLNRISMDELLQTIVDRTAQLVDAPYVNIDLVESNDILLTRAVTENCRSLLGERTRRGESGFLTWQAVETGVPAVIDDYSSWPRRRRDLDQWAWQATADVPVLSGKKCVGILSISRVEPGRPFSPDDLQLVTLLARLVALVLDNTQLYEASRRDLAERKLADEALRISQDRLNAALEATTDGLWDWNIVSDQTFFSPRLLEILGFNPGEWIEKATEWNSRIHPDDNGPDDQRLADHLAGLAPFYRSELRMRHKSGEWIWIAVNGKVVAFMPDGRPLRLVGTIADITKRKEAEEALRVSEMRYRLISELISDYAYTDRIEPERTFIPEWSAGSLLRLTGYTLEEVHARGGWVTLIYPPDRSLDQQFVETLFNGEPTTVELRIMTKSGEVRWIQDSARPEVDERGRLTRAFGSITDITERKRAEQKIQALNAELKRSNADLERLTDAVSHNLQEPLAQISTSIGELAGRHRDQLPPDANQQLDLILDSADRISKLVAGLLAKAHAGQDLTPHPQAILSHTVHNISLTMTGVKFAARRLKESGCQM